jgi:hypothetical protein
MSENDSTIPETPAGGSLPNAVYSKRTRARRIAEGGETVGGTLRPEAGRALRDIMETGAYPSKIAAIEGALIRENDRLRRRQAKAAAGGVATLPAGAEADPEAS